MNNVVAKLLILAALGLAAPAASAGKSIAIENNTGTALRQLALRRVGDVAWRSLAVVAAAGSSARVDFDEKDCAYDLRATISGVGQIVWSRVNLCDVKRVTLNRDPSGRHWVDYD